MRLAILIDVLESRGGGEKLAYFLAKRYNAELYTTKLCENNILPEFKYFNITVLKPISQLPFLKQESLLRTFKQIKLPEYDAILSLGNGYLSYSAFNNHPLILYNYGVSPSFSGPNNLRYWPKNRLHYRLGAWLWKRRIKNLDRDLVKNRVDNVFSISEFSRKNFYGYYGVDSKVINTPVETKLYRYKEQKGYYLLVDRFVPEKRIDIAINAFKRMPDKTLVIEGDGPMKKKLKKSVEGFKNIKFVGRVDTAKLRELYSESIALISLGFKQDWSMIMTEALSSGKPGICVNEGAYKEIIKEGQTGTLVEATQEGIIKGVKRITPDVAKSMRYACITQAKNYDKANFYKQWDSIFKNL